MMLAGASLRLVAVAPGAVEGDDAVDEAARGDEHLSRLAEERYGVLGEAERDDDHGAKGAITKRQPRVRAVVPWVVAGG